MKVIGFLAGIGIRSLLHDGHAVQSINIRRKEKR